jgi:hypothetical protein
MSNSVFKLSEKKFSRRQALHTSLVAAASTIGGGLLLAPSQTAHAAATTPYPTYRGTRIVSSTGIINPGQVLFRNDTVLSRNRQYALIFQDDGNLVLYPVGYSDPLWASNTDDATVGLLNMALVCIMQGDGNFVIYSNWAANRAVWTTRTEGNPGAHFEVQDDVNLVVYNPDRTPIWDRFNGRLY